MHSPLAAFPDPYLICLLDVFQTKMYNLWSEDLGVHMPVLEKISQNGHVAILMMYFKFDSSSTSMSITIQPPIPTENNQELWTRILPRGDHKVIESGANVKVM